MFATRGEIKIKKQINAQKEKVRFKVTAFMSALSQAQSLLGSEKKVKKALQSAIEKLSHVRNHGPGKNNLGLILLDQYFSVPQIGEVIRDLVILERLSTMLE